MTKHEEQGVIAAVPKVCKAQLGDVIVAVDPRYFRPTEVETLLGDPSKAQEKLGWRPRIDFPELVREMMAADLELARRDELLKQAGYRVSEHHE